MVHINPIANVVTTTGERVGCLTFVARSKASALAIISQLRVVVRTLWSNPPCHGGRIVSTVLASAALTQEWCVSHTCHVALLSCIAGARR